MLRSICAGICATLLLPTQNPLTSTVFRCEDHNGHITYTLQGCPTDAEQALQSADNPTPGRGKPIPLAKESRRARKSDSRETRTVVVGEKQDGCGNRITGSQRRNAMIRQQVRAGMTRRDIESSLGKPDKITTQDGQTRYHYADQKGNRRQVTFDEAGCVKGKR
jgi:hypothetical protein